LDLDRRDKYRLDVSVNSQGRYPDACRFGKIYIYLGEIISGKPQGKWYNWINIVDLDEITFVADLQCLVALPCNLSEDNCARCIWGQQLLM
jgi:hypothetical protein